MSDTLQTLYAVIQDRQLHPQEGSYTCYLFEKGVDKILKKVGEEWRGNHHRREERRSIRHGGRDFRSHLPPDGDDGRAEYPLGGCAG